MTIQLTDRQFGIVRHAMERIATGYSATVTAAGYRRPLHKHEMTMIAREACDAVGWPYYGIDERTR